MWGKQLRKFEIQTWRDRNEKKNDFELCSTDVPIVKPVVSHVFDMRVFYRIFHVLVCHVHAGMNMSSNIDFEQWTWHVSPHMQALKGKFGLKLTAYPPTSLIVKKNKTTKMK